MRKVICCEYEEGVRMITDFESKKSMQSFYNYLKFNHSKDEPCKVWVELLTEGEFKKAVNAGRRMA
jgi:hypothetical protein